MVVIEMKTQQPPTSCEVGGCCVIKMVMRGVQRQVVVPVGSFPYPKVGKEFLRKEVIQPQVPLRLPCYDLTLLIYI